jgi:hypothetical protein
MPEPILVAPQGHPVRATVSDMGLLLLDMKDLRAMLQHVGENAKSFTTAYANISAASVGAIRRGLWQIEEQGGDRYFGEPMLDISDFMQTADGQGVVNILAADQLMNAPAAQVERIELVVRLVRSKGVGVHFVTQNPLDVPDTVLAQLGNRVQHALRAFTSRDQKAVKSAADTLRANPTIGDMATAITELAVGQAPVSFLDAKGHPSLTERVFVLPPGSQIGPITPDQRKGRCRRPGTRSVRRRVDGRTQGRHLRQHRPARRAQRRPGGEGGGFGRAQHRLGRGSRDRARRAGLAARRRSAALRGRGGLKYSKQPTDKPLHPQDGPAATAHTRRLTVAPPPFVGEPP